jgi:hypothetical protein
MGSEGGNDDAEEKILAPAGVGVNGGPADFDAALRFFGRGVAGSDGAESNGSVTSVLFKLCRSSR